MANSTTIPWADTPFALIPTPGGTENPATLPPATFMAREMAMAHNGILRGLNSIYNQCLYVKSPQDIADLLLYTKFWCDWIHEHHEAEERLLFPELERITKVQGLMEKNVVQHHVFMPGLEELERYCVGRSPEVYNGRELQRITDGFGSQLSQHLTEEIGTLQGLEIYDAVALKEAFMKFDAELRKGDKSILFPMVLGTSDSKYEDGTPWPELPSVIKSLVHYWFERKYRGAWRFSPCTTWGEKRPLAFSEVSG